MSRPRPVFLFTDFGFTGPYVGQMFGAIFAVDPRITVISLMHDAPAMRPDLAAYLLPACCEALPPDAVVVAVVDPGVGGERAALVVDSGGRTFVGPDNGLLSRLPQIGRVERVDWRPASLSTSFHGRDLFAPAAARLALGESLQTSPLAAAALCGADWPAQAERVVYIDGYGNLMLGVSAENIPKNSNIRVKGESLAFAETFCRAPSGQLFWYANSLGLVEIAANGRSAARLLSLALGARILLD